MSFLKRWSGLLFILAITLIAAYIAQPSAFSLFGTSITVHKGLDLQGGTHLVYGLDTSGLAAEDQADAQRSVVEVIRRRIDAFGVAEPIIQEGMIGDTRTVVVELPGITDVSEAKNLIGKTAQLTFWEEGGETDCPLLISLALGATCQPTGLTGANLKRAAADVESAETGGSGSAAVVTLTFTSEGAELFGDITARNVGKPVAIVLDDQPISAPIVQQEIRGGTAIITGVGEVKQARELAIQLNAGALPVPIEVIEELTVGATLGNDAVSRSLIAGAIGFMIIAILMIALYRVNGLLATIALAIYTLITLSIFKLIPVTLTLAGISGFILSIGMAVDANILIFERMREELRAGRTRRAAIDEGFQRAWASVRDSNISSLITCAILFYFGTGLVRGFALTLAIGILVSMFTAVTVTRTFLRLVVAQRTK